MKTDRFLFNEAEAVLNKVEKIASCYDFKTKEVLQIRLMAEEIISVIGPTLALSDGGCRITTDKKTFAVTIDCDAGINGLDADTKKQLMKMSRTDKNKGVLGMIGKVFEFLMGVDIDYGALPSSSMICQYGMDNGDTGYCWSPEYMNFLSGGMSESDRLLKQAEERSLEISIIEGYADDIQVVLQKNKPVRLEITVVKNFASGQLAKIKINDDSSRTASFNTILI